MLPIIPFAIFCASSIDSVICTPPFVLNGFKNFPAPLPPACICDLITQGGPFIFCKSFSKSSTFSM